MDPTSNKLTMLLSAETLSPAERVAEAAAALGSLKADCRQRRRDRRYTGVVAGRRRPVGQLVKLPTGQVAKLLCAIRGKAFVTWQDEECIHPTQLATLNASDLVVVKNPAAVLLGSLKRGVKERPSLRKQRAARRNGDWRSRTNQRRKDPERSPSKLVEQVVL